MRRLPIVWRTAAALAALALASCQSEDPQEDTTVLGYDGLTAVHRAAVAGDVPELEHSLSVLRVDPDIRDLAGVTPLHYASRAGHLDAVKLLVSYGATPAIKTTTGWSAIDLALRENHFPVVRFLSQYGFNPDGALPEGAPYLVMAIQGKNHALAEFLVGLNANVNAPRPGGKSLLDEAIVVRDQALVNLLLDHGARVVQTQGGPNSPLHVAIEWRDFGMVNRLMAAGADPGVRNHDGWTASEHAASLGLAAIADACANVESAGSGLR